MTEPSEQRYTVPALQAFIGAAASVVGLLDDDRDALATGLIEADLRGVGTHGILRLPAYIRGLLSGELNKRPQLRQIKGKGAVSLVDADNGLGLVTGQAAAKQAVALAREHGIGVVSLINSNHTGMLAQHVMAAVDADMIGYFVSNGPPVMPPYGGQDPRISNNPFAYGFPTDTAFPLVLDMACSSVARGKIRLAALKGEPLPEGVALDSEGRPTTDASAAMNGVVLPMAGHKGYGIAVANEILSAVLPGALLSAQISQAFLREGARTLDRWGNGALAMAIDISAITDIADYRERIARFIATMREAQLAHGTKEILLPGEPEWRLRQERTTHGIPLPAAVVASLDEFAAEIHIPALHGHQEVSEHA